MQKIDSNSPHTPYIYNRIRRSTHTNGGRAKKIFGIKLWGPYTLVVQ